MYQHFISFCDWIILWISFYYLKKLSTYSWYFWCFAHWPLMYQERPRLEIREENTSFTNPLTKKIGIKRNVLVGMWMRVFQGGGESRAVALPVKIEAKFPSGKGCKLPFTTLSCCKGVCPSSLISFHSHSHLQKSDWRIWKLSQRCRDVISSSSECPADKVQTTE